MRDLRSKEMSMSLHVVFESQHLNPPFVWRTWSVRLFIRNFVEQQPHIESLSTLQQTTFFLAVRIHSSESHRLASPLLSCVWSCVVTAQVIGMNSIFVNEEWEGWVAFSGCTFTVHVHSARVPFDPSETVTRHLHFHSATRLSLLFTNCHCWLFVDTSMHNLDCWLSVYFRLLIESCVEFLLLRFHCMVSIVPFQ